MEGVVALDSGQTLEFWTVKPRITKPSVLLAHVKILRFPVPYGEPYEKPESGRGVNKLGTRLT